MGELQMKSKITIEMPVELVQAVQQAAKRDYTSLSNVIRRAVVRELRESGLLLREVA